MITAEHLRKLLNYDPETGVFRWRVGQVNGCPAGTLSGKAAQDAFWNKVGVVGAILAAVLSLGGLLVGWVALLK